MSCACWAISSSWLQPKCHHPCLNPHQSNSVTPTRVSVMNCCACHAKCKASSENVAKVLRLPHKTTFDTSWNMLEWHKVPRLPRKTTWQPVLKHSTKMGFAASQKTLRGHQRRQRLAMRHAGASKRTFRASLPYIWQFAASKSTFSYEFSYEPTSKSMFRARHPSIFITCDKMPPLPVTTSRSASNAIRRKHPTRHV